MTNSDLFHQRGRHLRSHGMSTLTLDRHHGRAYSYDVSEPGLNYRMDEIRAALGLVQLGKLEEANLLRKELMDHYRNLLLDINEVALPFASSNGRSCYHICPILLNSNLDRGQIMSDLKDEGIQTSIHYPSFKSFSCYSQLNEFATPIADDISSRELTLPLYPGMNFESVDIVVNALKKAVSRQ